MAKELHPLESAALPVSKAFKRRKQLERDIEHVTQEMYRRNRELAETNQTLSLLQTIDRLALDSDESLSEICNQIATAVVQTAGLPLIAILTTPANTMTDLELQGISTIDAALQQVLTANGRSMRVAMKSAWWPAGTTTRLVQLSAFTTEQMAKVLGITHSAAATIRQSGIQSVYVVQLLSRNRIVGFLVAGFYGYLEQVRNQDVVLLDRLSEPVGIALENRLLFDENKRVLAQLRRSNAKLKSLDATKDEFISMASHQLRTPLTAVKGYLSMVLEGDAGKLQPQQRKLLEQSYLSSQRMVYLISDLLNLSRLNTGKFIIESTPVSLADVVQLEVDQLEETARAREVSLHYEKPKNFPQLMLDETKIHQVVMNFIDNAIYYTPAGGRIEVALQETPSAVVFTVKDNGIGVPRAEQHHLFSKFYRADNAKRARPDGTGLGLFMAKKVIAAQGGAIIFESQEGKGSTFGFRFNKSAAPAAAHPAPQPAQTAAAAR